MVAKTREEIEITFKFKRGEWELITRILAQHNFSKSVVALNQQIRAKLAGVK